MIIKILKLLAVVTILGFPVAVIGFRLGMFPFSVSFLLMGATLFIAIAVFFIGWGLSFIKRADVDFAKSVRTSAMIALLPIVALGSQVFTGTSVPRIHNISTDVINPPVFDKVVALRTTSDNPLVYDNRLADIQLSAYPKIKTLTTNLSPIDAHVRAKAVVESMGLELVNSDPEKGIIEATETTTIWGFKDDIVVRITEKDNKTAVDLRSVSRIGQSDLGANAKRIEKFIAKF